MQVKFLRNVRAEGRGYRRGQVAELSDEAGRTMLKLGAAVELEPAEAMILDGDDEDLVEDQEAEPALDDDLVVADEDDD